MPRRLPPKAILLEEGVAPAQLLTGTVTDADLEEAGLSTEARAAIAAWRAPQPPQHPRHVSTQL